MADIAYKSPSLTGTALTFVAAGATGDTFTAAPRGFAHVRNGSAAAVTVTIRTPGVTEFGVDQPDVTLSIAAGAEKLIGPMSDSLVDPSDNRVKLTYSATASVTVAAVVV